MKFRRALAACEGALLVVDASQGIEAQTLANVYMALDHDLEIIPVINKIDLPSAQPDVVCKEIEDEIGLDTEGAPRVSAKQGIGIEDVLEAVADRVPPPRGDADAPLQALIFDSYYDNYRGAISSVRLMNGRVRVGDTIRMMASGREFEVTECGAFLPGSYLPMEELVRGRCGLHRRFHQGYCRHSRGRHHHPAGRAGGQGPAGLQKSASHGVLRHLSGGWRGLRRLAQRAGKIAPQRRGALL